MRRFCSYGPVDERKHFTVHRKKLVDLCADNLIGDPEEGGHYFTIWAPRQTGKTWLMHEAVNRIRERYGERFAIHQISLGKLRNMNLDGKGEWGAFDLPLPFLKLVRRFFPGNPEIQNWDDFIGLFSVTEGLWDNPLIFLIDEVDTASPEFLDILVGHFREMYLDRGNNRLHGLALVGVRAVLGVESHRGSPFNIQRSLHVPNFTAEEVTDLFRQYQEESGQKIDDQVVRSVYDATRGQPGLVGWFGELLTETYNVDKEKPIDIHLWDQVYAMATYSEWNNTVLNLIKKVKTGYSSHVIELFGRSDIRFSIDAEWCSYLYLNGIIDKEPVKSEQGEFMEICRFAGPFIQRRLYNALTRDLIGDRMPILPLEPTDDISVIWKAPDLDLPGLMERYKAYLKRLKSAGLNPWKNQPRRTDLHLTEAVGHFHLYAWLQGSVGKYCAISPEFPTGNGRVDLHLKFGDKRGIIEVKSFTGLADMETIRSQAAGYAERLSLTRVTIALFVPVEEEAVLEKLSGETVIEGVTVTVTAIGWV